MLTRLKELATQAASANAGSNLDKINAEAQSLLSEIDREANSTQYAGTYLLNGSYGVGVASQTFTAGAGYQAASGLISGDTYTVSITAGSTAGTANITITATVGTQAMTQTIAGIAEPASGQTSQVTFGALGLTLTLNQNLANAATASSGTNNVMNLVANTNSSSTFQVGTENNSNNQINISLGNVTVAGLNLTGLNLSSASGAQAALGTINTAISNLSIDQGQVGAAQNRLSYASANIATTSQNTEAAEASIKDADMASEMTNFTQDQVLMQAGTAMLAQANAIPNLVLSLFK